MRHAVTGNPTPPLNSPLIPVIALGVLLLVAMLSGCSRLRLPAIDPSGSCLFAPRGTTTSLALPGSGGEACVCSRCIQGLGGCLNSVKDKLGSCCRPSFSFPEPAFPEPALPPPCPTPEAGNLPGCGCQGGIHEPYVPSQPCNGSCKCGPPAVIYEDQYSWKRRCRLPKQGTRGCILLSPQNIIAPVGGEVILLSGICGTDGYLQTNQPLEWMLTPESVGTFIQVGDDDPGLLHRVVGSANRPHKHDPSYAHGLTSSQRMLITRGNTDPRDDVQLESGQTWISISSPSEGTSKVTVLAPESDCWDQRKATATIYWIDASWTFPGPQLVPAGQPVELTTRVTRAEGSIPATGWKVRYEILQPELATFYGSSGSSVLESTVDSSGNASVQLVPTPGTSGTATIGMQVIRPAGVSGNMPAMTLGQGQTYVTWSAPQLRLRAGAPPVATFNTPTEVVINVANPGDQAATNVRVDMPIPQGAQITNVDSFATQTPNALIWEIGTIPAGQQLDLFMSIAAQATVQLSFQATADGLRAEDSVRIDVFRPALELVVRPRAERYEAGKPATFDIDLTNIGDRPLQDVALRASGDEAMVHPDGSRMKEKQRDDNAPLQPGETWQVSIDFVPTAAGVRCITVQANAAGGQAITQQGCVTVINPVPPAQSLSAALAQLAGRNRIAVGEDVLITATITNSGEIALQGVQVTMVNDPQIQLVEATSAGKTSATGNLATWTIDQIAPGQSVILEGRFQATALNPANRIQLSAVSNDGIRASAEMTIAVIQAAQPAPVDPATALPPVLPSPEIPGGPGTPPTPLQGAPPGPLAPALPARSDSIQIDLFGRDNPVGVNQPIRYSLRIVNDSDQRDGQVLIQFPLPDGVRIARIEPVTNPETPELGEVTINARMASLTPIRTMNPGEVIEYEIVLSSNQPQTFALDILVRSQRIPSGVRKRVETDVR